jgi:hypothetical protein
MIEDREVVFKLKIDHDKVRKKYAKYLESPEKSELLDEQQVLLFNALLCCTFVYVPESNLSRFIEYGKVIEK